MVFQVILYIFISGTSQVLGTRQKFRTANGHIRCSGRFVFPRKSQHGHSSEFVFRLGRLDYVRLGLE
jgi:hypothetical protein